MTRQEIEALLMILAEMERQELPLRMRERREAERKGGCIEHMAACSNAAASNGSVLLK